MRKYNLNQEVDWRWLLKMLEAEIDREVRRYHCWTKEDCEERRRAYLENTLSFYISLRSFLKLSPITRVRNRAEEFIKNGSENRW